MSLCICMLILLFAFEELLKLTCPRFQEIGLSFMFLNSWLLDWNLYHNVVKCYRHETRHNNYISSYLLNYGTSFKTLLYTSHYWWECLWVAIREIMMATDFRKELRVSVSLGTPWRAQLTRWLLAQLIWLTCPKDVYTLRSGCWGCSVVRLIGYCWGQVVRAA